MKNITISKDCKIETDKVKTPAVVRIAKSLDNGKIVTPIAFKILDKKTVEFYLSRAKKFIQISSDTPLKISINSKSKIRKEVVEEQNKSNESSFNIVIK